MQRAKPSAAASKVASKVATPERGADELPWIASRQKSRPFEEEAALRMLGELLEERRSDVGAEGVAAHRQGTTLLQLYRRHADRVLGFDSFRRFLQQHWPDSVDDAYRRMRIARYCTRREARLGISRCDRGIRLMRALELDCFGALNDPRRPLLLTLPSGELVTFADASIHQLDAVLGLLAAQRAAKTREEPTLGRMLGYLRELTESRPEFRELRPSAVLVDDQVEVRVRVRGQARQQLAARFFDALSRMG